MHSVVLSSSFEPLALNSVHSIIEIQIDLSFGFMHSVILSSSFEPLARNSVHSVIEIQIDLSLEFMYSVCNPEPFV